MTEQKKPIIVIIEDEASWQERYQSYLARESAEIKMFSNHTDADAWLADNKADIIFTDKKIEKPQPESDGIEWIRKFRERDQSTPIILVSSFASRREVLEAGAQEYLSKGRINERALHSLIEEWVGKDIALAAGTPNTERSR